MKSSPGSDIDSQQPILVIEDDPTTSKVICSILAGNGLKALPLVSGSAAISFLRSEPRVGAILIDIALPDFDGIEVLRVARSALNGVPCFMLTAKDDPQTVVMAMKAGASDYFTKPVNPERLVYELQHAMAVNTCAPETLPHAAVIDKRWKSGKMRQVVENVVQASLTGSPVMIQGPRYTGKSAIARMVHEASPGANTSFRAFDLAVLPQHVIESKLFGGALVDSGGDILRLGGALGRVGGGSLYLENIDSLEPGVQRALAEWLMRSSRAPAPQSGPRLIASSSTDIEALVDQGRFRRDLWFLLAVHRIVVPSLAERKLDLPTLCNDIITSICVKARIRRPTLSQKAFEKIEAHSWPFNLMELQNVLEHAVAHTSDGLVTPADLPWLSGAENHLTNASPAGLDCFSSIDDVTRASLVAALEACGGNRRKAAQRLKVSLRTVYNMIKRYNIEKSSSRQNARKPGEGSAISEPPPDGE